MFVGLWYCRNILDLHPQRGLSRRVKCRMPESTCQEGTCLNGEVKEKAGVGVTPGRWNAERRSARDTAQCDNALRSRWSSEVTPRKTCANAMGVTSLGKRLVVAGANTSSQKMSIVC